MTDVGVPDSEVRSSRLRLLLMSPEFMEASLRGVAEGEMLAPGVTLPADWPAGAESVLRRRLEQVRRHAEAAPWLLRAIVRTTGGEMVGYINFHGPPLAGKAELGYTVFAPYRRQGYAGEAASAMMAWAEREHGVSTFVVSIAPDNEPSLALAAHLGFRRTGSQIDEVDREEWVFERQGAPSGQETASR